MAANPQATVAKCSHLVARPPLALQALSPLGEMISLDEGTTWSNTGCSEWVLANEQHARLLVGADHDRAVATIDWNFDVLSFKRV
jgi:hypothetical protein